MAYPSVDELQKTLTKDVFHYAKDSKKAAGRALGTLVEIIAFYTFKSWNIDPYISIETAIPEYMNEDITHNVEFSIHPAHKREKIVFKADSLPITSKKLCEKLDIDTFSPTNIKNNQLLSKNLIVRNACNIYKTKNGFVNAYLREEKNREYKIIVSHLHNHPFAIIECKRVGIEEGMRKGPQTIEKAKQGAYVARTISSLQKIRLNDGSVGGIIQLPNGKFKIDDYNTILNEIIMSNEQEYLENFVLTIGVVSNHGNWFTSDNHNKELKVLAQSYDWLLFLTDVGLSEFIGDLIQKPKAKYQPIRDAFLNSYSGTKGKNQFTKVKMNLKADIALQDYFSENRKKIQSWYNIITPKNKKINVLKKEIDILVKKDWGQLIK